MTIIYQLNQFFYTFFTTFFTWLVKRAEDVLRLSSNVFCSPPPLPARTTQQLELIWLEMSTRHLFFKFFLFVFHLFFIFKIKKNKKNCYPRPSTWNLRHKDGLVCGQAFPSSPSPSPVIHFFFCSCPNILDELARKRLLCRLISFGFRTCVPQFL